MQPEAADVMAAACESVCVRARACVMEAEGFRVLGSRHWVSGLGSRHHGGQEARERCRMLEKLLESIKDMHAPHRPGPFCPEVRDLDGTRGLFYDTPS